MEITKPLHASSQTAIQAITGEKHNRPELRNSQQFFKQYHHKKGKHSQVKHGKTVAHKWLWTHSTQSFNATAGEIAQAENGERTTPNYAWWTKMQPTKILMPLQPWFSDGNNNAIMYSDNGGKRHRTLREQRKESILKPSNLWCRG